MTPHPLVTVVTPCLNPGERLARCLASVSAQTYPHVEHLVMDGGSDDGTLELLRASDVRWWSEPDSGQSQAINRGFARASGQILTWLNADDLLVPEAVEKVVQTLERQPSIDIVAGTARLVGDGEDRLAVPPGQLTLASMDLHTPIAQPACFFTAESWNACGPLDEDLHLAMDLDLWYRFVTAGFRYARIDDVLAVIEFHEDAKTMAVPRLNWEQEYALVRQRHGRERARAINLGRAAVHGLRRHTGEPTIEQLRSELERACPRHIREAMAGARLERASFGGRRRVRDYLHPDVWRVGETRGILLRALLRRLERLR